MKIICMGDSLTEGDYGVFGKSGIGNVQKENYPYFLSKLTGAEVLNYGKCGYRASTYLDYYKSGKADVSGSDAVIVMLGTNGGMDDEKITNDNLAYDELIKNIKRDAPCAKIFLCTPPHVTVQKEKSNYGYAEQVEKAVRFVRKYSEENGYECIDLALCDMFTDENEVIMQPNDGLHYCEIGYAVMAVYIKNALKKSIVTL